MVLTGTAMHTSWQYNWKALQEQQLQHSLPIALPLPTVWRRVRMLYIAECTTAQQCATRFVLGRCLDAARAGSLQSRLYVVLGRQAAS